MLPLPNMISPLLKEVALIEFKDYNHSYYKYISQISLYFKIFNIKFFLKMLLILSPKLLIIMSRVIDKSTQLVLASNVFDLMASVLPITALTPTLYPAFKSNFFSRTVTIPSCTI